MPTIFISYRRADTGDLCDRLATRLRWAFGEDAVFRDVNTILAGSSFPDALREGIEACPVMLALIGPQWLAEVGNPPHRRIDDAGDWVRAEIASALRLGHLVIPVLATGAPALDTANLPPDLELLTRFTAMPLRPGPTFDADVAELTRAVRPYARRGPASWALLVGGVFLTFVYLSLVAIDSNSNALFKVVWIVGWFAQIALGGYMIWRALSRRAWGWLAAGALAILCGVSQYASLALSGAVATYVYTVINLVATPLAAGLILLAGWIGPRLARAPDALYKRWSGWHTAQAILLGLTTVAFAWSWLSLGFPTNTLTKLLVLGLIAFTALLTAATGILASVRAFTYRHIWWGVAALALTALTCLVEVLSVDAADVAALTGSVVVPVIFLIFMLVWLRSYASRASASARATTPAKERAA